MVEAPSVNVKNTHTYTHTNADQWTAAAQGEGEWRRAVEQGAEQFTAKWGEWRRAVEQGAEQFTAKWSAVEKARAGLRHALVCPNVTGRTKDWIAQSKRARGSLAIV